MSLELKLIAAAVGLLGLIVAVYFGLDAMYAKGLAAGRAEIQIAWDVDKAKIQTLADTARSEVIAQEFADSQRNQGVVNGLQYQLDQSNAAGATLAQRLRNALARPTANSRAVPQVPNQPATPVAGGVTGSPDAIDRSLAAYDAACSRDALRLNAIIAETVPQLH